MSLVSGIIPSLANGISQQPATARLSSQGELQENGRSSIVAGLGKRPPTHHIAKIHDGDLGDATLHLINRDINERYSVVVSNNNIQVFDLDGDEKTVTIEDADDYLVADDPKTAFRAVTVADYTILVNTEKTVEMRPTGGSSKLTIVDPQTDDEYVISVTLNKAGIETSYNSTYTVTAGQTAAQVAEGIKTAMNAVAVFSTYFTVTNTAASVNTSLNSYIAGISEFDMTVYINDEFLPAVSVPLNDTDPAATGVTEFKVYETESYEGFVFVKQGNYGTKYRIQVQDDVRGFFAETTTSNTDTTTIDTKNIAATLYNTIIAVTNFTTDYTATLSGNLIRFKKISPKNARFVLKCEDGNGNRNMIAVKDNLQKFVDLPSSCYPGFRVKIIGDSASSEDDYYVQFAATPGASVDESFQGVWEEVSRLGEPKKFEPATMPHVLIRQADGTFTFGQQEWDSRGAGDGDSSPEPSFVGRTINDVVFFRNRLGFLSDENAILSATGPGYFRFWRGTVTAILDGDPIDVAASNVSVSILRNAVPYSADKMLLFSDQKQFIFSGGDLLTPKTAAIKPSTSYETLTACKPVTAGKAVYFPTPKGDHAGVREYSTDGTTAVDDAVDVTAHVPAYIPSNVFKIAPCPNEDTLILLTRDDNDTMYVYKYYFVGQDKLQASWSKWPMSHEILDASFISSTLYLVVQREDGVYLESIGIEAKREDTNFDYEILLDRRFEVDSGDGVYSAVTNLTTWTLPYETSGTVQAIVRGTPPAGFYRSQMVPLTKVAGNTSVTAVGDWSTVPLFMGVKYTFTYGLSEIVLKQSAGQGGERPLTGGRLQVRTLSLVYEASGYFRVVVTPTYGTAYTYTFTPKRLGSYVAGELNLENGEFRFPVFGKSDEVSIQIINDSPFPSNFLNATWEAEFILRTRRM